uniref:Variant surface glycoprotein 1377 n=1 Tax=Trypanosoma brucei TaxID=5691 RepID=M4SW99_9TRYP|nr:variant surface glycoprotein 1377 [Trypanosoma brucei]
MKATVAQAAAALTLLVFMYSNHADTAHGKIKKLQDSAKAGRELALKLEILAEQGTAENKNTAFVALAAGLTAQAEAKTSAAAAFTAVAVRATATAMEAVGGIEDAIQLLKTSTTGSEYCLGSDGTPTSDGSATAKDLGCEGNEPQLDGSEPSVAETVLSATGYAEIDTVTTTNGVADSDKCGMWKKQSLSSGPGHSTAATAELVFGLMKITGNEQVTRNSLQQINTANRQVAKTLLEKVHFDRLEVQAQETSSATTDINELLKAAARDGAALAEVKCALKDTNPDIKRTDFETTAKSKLTELFKADGSNAPEIWNVAKKTPVTDITATGAKTKEIDAVTGIETLQATMSYYMRAKAAELKKLEAEFKKLKEDKENKKAKISEEKECNSAGDDEEKCKELKEKGYTSDENKDKPKCTLKKK